MSDYRGILGYRSVGLVKFHCMSYLQSNVVGITPQSERIIYVKKLRSCNAVYYNYTIVQKLFINSDFWSFETWTIITCAYTCISAYTTAERGLGIGRCMTHDHSVQISIQ